MFHCVKLPAICACCRQSLPVQGQHSPGIDRIPGGYRVCSGPGPAGMPAASPS